MEPDAAAASPFVLVLGIVLVALGALAAWRGGRLRALRPFAAIALLAVGAATIVAYAVS